MGVLSVTPLFSYTIGVLLLTPLISYTVGVLLLTPLISYTMGVLLVTPLISCTMGVCKKEGKLHDEGLFSKLSNNAHAKKLPQRLHNRCYDGHISKLLQTSLT